MISIETHKQIYTKLTGDHPSIPFIPRRTNRGNKLDDGYIFQTSNEDKVIIIPFWEGTNWKTKSYNIYFAIFDDSDPMLVINVQDSNEKQEFAYSIVGTLGMEEIDDNVYVKGYPYEWEEALDKFIKEHYEIIDNAVSKLSMTCLNPIKLIDWVDFKNDRENINNRL